MSASLSSYAFANDRVLILPGRHEYMSYMTQLRSRDAPAKEVRKKKSALVLWPRETKMRVGFLRPQLARPAPLSLHSNSG